MEWECSSPGSDVQFLPPGVSDHFPLVVKLADLPRAKIPFKFFDFWADHPDFLHLVARVWEEAAVGTPMYQLCMKLRKLKAELKKFNKEFFSNLPSRVVQAKEKMENVQRLIQLSPLNVNLHHEESVAVKEYGDFSRAEESFLKQKSRVQWLNFLSLRERVLLFRDRSRRETNRSSKSTSAPPSPSPAACSGSSAA